MRSPKRPALSGLLVLLAVLALASSLPLRCLAQEVAAADPPVAAVAPSDQQPFIMMPGEMTGENKSPDVGGAGYYDDKRGDRERTIPIHKAGGLRNSRHDVSGFTLYELNEINKANLKGYEHHGNGISGSKLGDVSNGGLGPIGSGNNGDFGGGPIKAAGAGGEASAAGYGSSNAGYGSSSDYDYVEKGMAKAILRQRFAGLANIEQKHGLPGDAVIAVGKYQIVEAVNNYQRLAVYKKTINKKDRGDQYSGKYDIRGMPYRGAYQGYSYSSYPYNNEQSGKYRDDEWNSCYAFGCGSGYDHEYNDYESDYGYEDNDGSAYGSNGGFGASDYGHSGYNEDLDYTSSKAHHGDKKNQAGDKRRLIVGPLPFTAIWTGFYGPCETDPSGSFPMVHYDSTAGRFVLVHVTRPKAKRESTLVCVAVSKSEDATGLYNRYAFEIKDVEKEKRRHYYSADATMEVADDNDVLLMNPKLSVWPASNSYFITFDTIEANEKNIKEAASFGHKEVDFTGVLVLGIDRENVLQAQLADARFGVLNEEWKKKHERSAPYHGCLVTDQDGYNISPYYDALLVCLDPKAGVSKELHTFTLHFDWYGGSFVISGPKEVHVPQYYKACGTFEGCVPQLGTNNKLSANGAQLNYRAAYRTFFCFDPYTNKGSSNLCFNEGGQLQQNDGKHGGPGGLGAGGKGGDIGAGIGGKGDIGGGVGNDKNGGQGLYQGSYGPGNLGINQGGYFVTPDQLGNQNQGGKDGPFGAGGPGGKDGPFGAGGAGGKDGPFGAGGPGGKNDQGNQGGNQGSVYDDKNNRPISAGENLDTCLWAGSTYSDRSHSGSIGYDRAASNPLFDSLCTDGDDHHFGRTFNQDAKGSDRFNNYGPGAGHSAGFGSDSKYGMNRHHDVVSDYLTLSHSVFASHADKRVLTRYYVLRRVRNNLLVVQFGTIVPKPNKNHGYDEYKGKYGYDEYGSSYGADAYGSRALSSYAASLAMDASGNLGAGYSVSGPDTFPQIRFATLAAPYKNSPKQLQQDDGKHGGPGGLGAGGKDGDIGGGVGGGKGNQGGNQQYGSGSGGYGYDDKDKREGDDFGGFNDQRENDFDLDKYYANPSYEPKAKEREFSGGHQLGPKGRDDTSPRCGHFSSLVLDPNDCFWWYVNTIVPKKSHEVHFASIIFGLQSALCDANPAATQYLQEQERGKHGGLGAGGKGGNEFGVNDGGHGGGNQGYGNQGYGNQGYGSDQYGNQYGNQGGAYGNQYGSGNQNQGGLKDGPFGAGGPGGKDGPFGAGGPGGPKNDQGQNSQNNNQYQNQFDPNKNNLGNVKLPDQFNGQRPEQTGVFLQPNLNNNNIGQDIGKGPGGLGGPGGHGGPGALGGGPK